MPAEAGNPRAAKGVAVPVLVLVLDLDPGPDFDLESVVTLWTVNRPTVAALLHKGERDADADAEPLHAIRTRGTEGARGDSIKSGLFGNLRCGFQSPLKRELGEK